QSNFQEPLSLVGVAREVGVSPGHLSTLLSTQLNISFPSFLNATRLNHALPLLKHSDVPITQICYECGFNSIRTFNRAFQAEFNLSPREMRNSSVQSAGESSVVHAQQFNVYTGYNY
ncbi:MAG TPA: AraC family transcriptional regulator, partial [Clostridia bacterium]|nr:AraC family transcriptional regulator [Clostridia bacterium]